MKRKSNNYEKYFSSGQQAKIIIRLSDSKSIDKFTEISAIDSDLIWLELLGDGIAECGQLNKSGIKVSLSASSGWGVFRCTGVFVDVCDSKKICIRLTGQVEEQQRREYFRLDVEVPLLCTVPADQHIVAVTQEWNARIKRYLSVEPVMHPAEVGYKVVKWLGGADLMPLNVNLSGGGLRFKSPDYLEPGTLVLVDLFLPLAPSRVITVVAEILRCSEIQLSWEKGTSYITAMKFTNIDERERELIISFVFCEQRNKLKASTEKKT